ncbi:Uncharacterized protein HZ326_11889 [Fusarium oxysporum f. sp. albedinis]|nr:Uncharacterized protein HZ326_11889 [Fusarium oxysporum f. sp. albedinis]
MGLLRWAICVYGTKVCGKSVLIKSIVLELGEQGQIALHFSFWSSNENQRKLEDLLRSLAWQISRRITDVNLEKVSKFRVALSGISQKVYFTIDGIDGSSEDWDSNTDGCLSTILDLVKNHTKLHVLLTGQEASGRMLLKNDVLRLQITEHLIRGDIDKQIADKGTLRKASISMKRARYILSSILACPRSMTGEDKILTYLQF